MPSLYVEPIKTRKDTETQTNRPIGTVHLFAQVTLFLLAACCMSARSALRIHPKKRLKDLCEPSK